MEWDDYDNDHGIGGRFKNRSDFRPTDEGRIQYGDESRLPTHGQTTGVPGLRSPLSPRPIDPPDGGIRGRAVVPGFSPYLEESTFIYTPYHRAMEGVFTSSLTEDEDESREEVSSYSGLGPRSWRRSDGEIREDVCELLAEHPDVDASEIEVQVSEGVVLLRGSVPSRQMKRLAEDCVDEVPGLVDVRNELRIPL